LFCLGKISNTNFEYSIRNFMPLSDTQLLQLLTDLESDRVERKESFKGDAPAKVRQAVCAFANDLPGHQLPGVVFIGARDKEDEAKPVVEPEPVVEAESEATGDASDSSETEESSDTQDPEDSEESADAEDDSADDEGFGEDE
jgi:predicted HTH transcriptional regulator